MLFIVFRCGRKLEEICASSKKKKISISFIYKESVPHILSPHEQVVNLLRDNDTIVLAGEVLHDIVASTVDASAEEKSVRSRIPVVILTGFLGSGKTTMLNHLLQVQREKKYAVIENEFGEVGLDGELVGSITDTAEQIVTLDNGCMCCSVR